jgi:hypothetical protein
MKRVFTVLLLVVLAALTTVAAGSGAGGESGPGCADVINETHNYSYDAAAGTGVISLRMQLSGDAAACKQITYTLVVSGVSGNPVVTTQKGSVDFVQVRFGDTDNKICISGTTTSAGGHVYDNAPDLGCLEITPGVSGGTSGFN